jgi:hypothetical protein
MKSPKFWIVSAVVARMAYVAMNEYGMNPFKKNLEGEHVYLTGAGSGIGRQLAVKLGLLGCKLSLSNITKSKMDVTKEVLRKAGVPEMNINCF